MSFYSHNETSLAMSTLAIWCRLVRSGDVHPCDVVPFCQVSRCPPLRCGAVLSSLAMSTLAIWCRFVRSRDVHPCDMVPSCPVSRCQSTQFRWSRDVRSRFFSRPLSVSVFALRCTLGQLNVRQSKTEKLLTSLNSLYVAIVLTSFMKKRLTTKSSDATRDSFSGNDSNKYVRNSCELLQRRFPREVRPREKVTDEVSQTLNASSVAKFREIF